MGDDFFYTLFLRHLTFSKIRGANGYFVAEKKCKLLPALEVINNLNDRQSKNSAFPNRNQAQGKDCNSKRNQAQSMH